MPKTVFVAVLAAVVITLALVSVPNVTLVAVTVPGSALIALNVTSVPTPLIEVVANF